MNIVNHSSSRRTRYVLLTILSSLALSLFGTPTNAQPVPTNLTDSCVKTVDVQVDYFPQKATLKYTQGFKVEYFKTYKVVTLTTPYPGAEEGLQYVLVQCGTTAPAGYENALRIEVPVKSAVMMSTTYLPYLEPLGILDRLVGVDSFDYINTPAVVKLIESKKLTAIGSGSAVNTEAAIDLNPDLIMTYGSGSSEYDSHPKLLEAGLKVALNAEFLDTTPLGRTEWMKYIALFFNREATAESAFDATAKAYEDLAIRARAATDKPTLFAEIPYQGTWYMPGGKSFAATLLTDAGANYLWNDDKTTGSLNLAFEAVFERAAAADYWVNVGFVPDLKGLVAADERFADFAAYKEGKVWNNDLRTNANGGNDYYETGVARPDLVLADLVAIFHPELVKDHTFTFYRQLK